MRVRRMTGEQGRESSGRRGAGAMLEVIDIAGAMLEVIDEIAAHVQAKQASSYHSASPLQPPTSLPPASRRPGRS